MPEMQATSAPRPRLLEVVRRCIRSHRLSRSTEKAYLGWIRRLVRFHGRRHPAEMAEPEINAFLTHLAVERKVSASTQTQALCAILFLYRHVLRIEIGELEGLIRAKRRRKLPVVLSVAEVKKVFGTMTGTPRLYAALLYGSGLRAMEGLRLRIKDVDFDSNEIIVREGKGRKDRRTVLPESLKPALRTHLDRVRAVHQRDLRDGLTDVNYSCRLTTITFAGFPQ